jgi:hypothetical protein
VKAIGNYLGNPLKELNLPNVSQPFKIENGKIEYPPVQVPAHPLELSIGGTTGIDGKLDHQVMVKAQPGGLGNPALGRFAQKGIPIPLRVGGTIGAPSLVPPSAADLGSLAKEAILEEGADILEGVLKGKKGQANPNPANPVNPANPAAPAQPAPPQTPAEDDLKKKEGEVIKGLFGDDDDKKKKP